MVPKEWSSDRHYSTKEDLRGRITEASAGSAVTGKGFVAVLMIPSTPVQWIADETRLKKGDERGRGGIGHAETKVICIAGANAQTPKSKAGQ